MWNGKKESFFFLSSSVSTVCVSFVWIYPDDYPIKNRYFRRGRMDFRQKVQWYLMPHSIIDFFFCLGMEKNGKQTTTRTIERASELTWIHQYGFPRRAVGLLNQSSITGEGHRKMEGNETVVTPNAMSIQYLARSLKTWVKKGGQYWHHETRPFKTGLGGGVKTRHDALRDTHTTGEVWAGGGERNDRGEAR